MLGLDAMGDDIAIDSINASFSNSGTMRTSNATNKNAGGGGGMLPPGRSTLNRHSGEMLLMANGVRIFALLETPLDAFLRKEIDKGRHRSTPQVLRQLEVALSTLVLFSMIAFLIIVLVLLIRSDGARQFFHGPNWTLPFLSALIMLPVSTPIFLFWVECIGISRILARVHPLAYRRVKPNSATTTDGHRENSVHSSGCVSHSEDRGMIVKPTPQLLCRYVMTTSTYRLFTKSLVKRIAPSQKRPWGGRQSSLLSIPPASLHLLEKLGLVTALALVDDELACEPSSTPQQLLIPSGQGGFTLLDMCPVYGDDNITDEDENESSCCSRGSNRIMNRSSASVDSDESNEETRYRYNHAFQATARAVRTISSYRKKYVGAGRRRGHAHRVRNLGADIGDDDIEKVQFEDPEWWKHLPSLKCIGLACLLLEEKKRTMSTQILETQGEHNPTGLSSQQKVSFDVGKSTRYDVRKARPLSTVETSLVDHICNDERERKHLKLLAQCIGFETSPGDLGVRGDLSCFHERRRLHILSTTLLRQRMQLDSHALGLEESRNGSRLFTDADAVFVRDKRSGGDLVLTVGDSRVVTVSSKSDYASTEIKVEIVCYHLPTIPRLLSTAHVHRSVAR
jgi:hypothetical protein